MADDQRDVGRPLPRARRRAGVDELAKAHIRTRFDVDDFETFCEAVVEWPNERHKPSLEEALAGGLKMAEQGIRDVTDAVDSEDR